MEGRIIKYIILFIAGVILTPFLGFTAWLIVFGCGGIDLLDLLNPKT